MPNSIIIDVDPPLEDGGEKVTGYHVEYEEKAQEFRTGREDNSCPLSVKQFSPQSMKFSLFLTQIFSKWFI